MILEIDFHSKIKRKRL